MRRVTTLANWSQLVVDDLLISALKERIHLLPFLPCFYRYFLDFVFFFYLYSSRKILSV